MKTNKHYNYEESILNIDDVLYLIEDALQNHKPFSLGRFGHGEIAHIGWSIFPQWKAGFDPHGSYAGATASNIILQDDLLEALRITDVAGLHTSWGDAWEDKEGAKLTKQLLRHFKIRPTKVCSAYITHEMIVSDRFWKSLKKQKIALVGRRAEEAFSVLKKKGMDITYTTKLEGYEDIEKVYNDLSKRADWDIALLSAGIPATILAPRLANQTSRVVIDFGHALDKFLDGENYNYEKILEKWKEINETEIVVSMVMAVYNGEKFLQESLDSALSQTYKNMEVIVVNDGSTDSTKNILNKITDKRVKVIHLERNQGAANALNIGIKKAKGSWIAIQDADDKSYPQRIEKQVKYIRKHPKLVGVGTFIECIRGSSDLSEGLLQGVAEKTNLFASSRKIRKNMYSGCPLTHSSVMFSKDVFLRVGGYNTAFKISYDYDLWLKLLEKGEMENIKEVLVQYRICRNSLSNKNGTITANEMQIASSKSIYRLFKKKKKKLPRVIVIGPRNGCQNYKKHIAPVSGLIVESLIYKEYKKQVPYAIHQLKEEKVDAIIVLGGYKTERILYDLKRRKLRLNVQFFNLYNVLK